MKKAIQMWSFNDRVKDGKSLLEALEIVAEIGYDGVEFAGTFDIPAKEMKETLTRLGLVPISCHEGADRLENNIDEIIAYHHELGTKYIGCAWGPTSSMEDLKHLRQILENAQKKAEPFGMKVIYHNHNGEFKTVEGIRPIDEIAKWSLLEPDTYWVLDGGDNPSEFLRRYQDRVEIIHLKDGLADGTGKGTALGDGDNDLKSIIDTAREIGIEWAIAEIENSLPDAESVRDARNGFAYMTKELGM